MEKKIDNLEEKFGKQLSDINEKINKVLESTVNDTGFMEENDVHDLGIFLAESVKDYSIGIVDNGAPKSIVGEDTFEDYLEENSINEDDLDSKQITQHFCFGDSEVFPSLKVVKMPFRVEGIGGEKVLLSTDVAVVKRNIPLLIGKNTLKQWKAKLDHEEDKLVVKLKRNEFDEEKILEIKTTNTKSGHTGLRLSKVEDSSMEKRLMLLKRENKMI